LIGADSKERIRLKSGSRGKTYVFTRENGRPCKSIRTIFEKALDDAKLQGVTPHTLRHTFASRLAMTAVGDRSLQALGRWKEPKRVQRYAHLSPQHLREAVERIADNSTTIFATTESLQEVREDAKLYVVNNVGP
jgi:integrase